MVSTPYFASISGLMNRQPIVVSSSFIAREYAPSALPMTKGARDMLSTPPAITNSTSPLRIARAAVATASMLEPHRRFTVVPGTSFGKPDSRSAMRATFRLSSPDWFAQPKTTSSTAPQSTLAFLFIKALIGIAARSSARMAASVPPYRPIGVRMASQMYAVSMGILRILYTSIYLIRKARRLLNRTPENRQEMQD